MTHKFLFLYMRNYKKKKGFILPQQLSEKKWLVIMIVIEGVENSVYLYLLLHI